MRSFALGQTVATRGVVELMAAEAVFGKFVSDSFKRYIYRDWGDTCESDWKLNDMSVSAKDRILAVYKHPEYEDWTIWIITEWDRSVTTILFPDEY